MQFDFQSPEPIFLQVSNQIEDAIFTGAFKEGTQIPSTTEISKTFQINPATVLKGMNILVNNNLLEKQRGRGTFVTYGAQQRVINERREHFYHDYILNLINESKKLHLSKDDILELIKRGYDNGKNRN
ncbi:GntR family transcriptional regulator [Apilactobacillus timberlakei]|uniref:GntR family transcriptional regulator n=1 Tax=Apilactobacillus timberlakei TaxID=2008380 RepID=UPI00112C0DC2|nr:GntR family transcriptional regulator [Apilactobacillus timberlakei]TPR18504.1 GntR family transcriptional regulator [Apilactobacillus timberlakei]TPR20351.1 GntR family transcriptional regulator [Apilactobacillus timberlakei]TPR22114.1 GntR family transcriptional regulator [Apilactobacillus timberlakei]